MEQEVQTAVAAKGRAGKADESSEGEENGWGGNQSKGHLGERCPAPAKCHLKGFGPRVA